MQRRTHKHTGARAFMTRAQINTFLRAQRPACFHVCHKVCIRAYVCVYVCVCVSHRLKLPLQAVHTSVSIMTVLQVSTHTVLCPSALTCTLSKQTCEQRGGCVCVCVCSFCTVSVQHTCSCL